LKRLRFARQAKRDLFDIGDWIAADRPLAARQVVSRLIERTSALRDAPEMGPLYPVYGDGVRGLSVRPYLILYRVADEDVFIERVIHGARLPKTLK
jgi:toxin ParE1/3/4